MPLTWSENENPVSSSKLNKMSVTSWANEGSIDTSQIKVGSILYLEDVNKLKIVKEISPSLVLKAVGGGGMKLDLHFGSFRRAGASDPDTLIVSLAEAIDGSGTGIGQLRDHISDNGGAVATHNSNKTFVFKDVNSAMKTFNGKPIGKIFISVALNATLTYTTNQAPTFKFNNTNTKIEILDGTTVKGSIALPADVSKAFATGSRHNLITIMSGWLDLDGYVFTTEFKIRVTIQTNTTITTDLTTHAHRYFAFQNSDTSTTNQPASGEAQIEVLE